MNSLVDEIRVATVYLPLATYPAAIDGIAPLIDAGKFNRAQQEIYNTLNSLVSTEEVTPLSIIRAEEKLIEAFQIESDSDLSNQITKNKIANLLKDANQNVSVAQLLGYGSKIIVSSMAACMHCENQLEQLALKANGLKSKNIYLHLKTRLSTHTDSPVESVLFIGNAGFYLFNC